MSSGDVLHTFIADLHIHTVLSPCGSLEMSPLNIVREAARKGLDIIGITDHNASEHGKVVKDIAKEYGIMVMCGMEVTTAEEAHCLTFFEDLSSLESFQQIIDSTILKIKNDPNKFGYQVIVDKQENITGQKEWLLISATTMSIEDVIEKAHQLGGIAIPAHIDRPSYSLTSQLGFVPPGLNADAMEVSRFSSRDEMVAAYPYLKDTTFIRSSDAHFLKDLGTVTTKFRIQSRTFTEIKKALQGLEGRRVTT